MRKKSLVIILIIVSLVIGAGIFITSQGNRKGGLVGTSLSGFNAGLNAGFNSGRLKNPVPVSSGQTPTPVLQPEVEYNQNTNLSSELEKVNPEVLDSDFEGLNEILINL